MRRKPTQKKKPGLQGFMPVGSPHEELYQRIETRARSGNQDMQALICLSEWRLNKETYGEELVLNTTKKKKAHRANETSRRYQDKCLDKDK